MTEEKALNAVEKAIDLAYERGKEDTKHIVGDFFLFARYLNENFHYFDNTDVGDVYKDNDLGEIYSEKDIYDKWLNNRKG